VVVNRHERLVDALRPAEVEHRPSLAAQPVEPPVVDDYVAAGLVPLRANDVRR
jgi:hypothetical protein